MTNYHMEKRRYVITYKEEAYLGVIQDLSNKMLNKSSKFDKYIQS